jgi:D-glycero-alpha-D-manno-heptose-7-phosphate kinase
MIISRTPFRVSFFGGGTDYPAWYTNNGGAVLATTIDKYCYITCRFLPPFFEHRIRVVYRVIETCQNVNEIEHPVVREVLRYLNIDRGVEIHHDADLPAGSGMGTSSSFTVGLLHALYALKGQMPSKLQLGLESIDIEQNRVLETVGSQDQISAAYGGINHITFSRNGDISVRPITVSADRVNELSTNLMLFYTGFARTASMVAASYVDNIESKEVQLNTLAGMVEEGVSILADGRDIQEFGKLLHESWLVKRALSPEVSNSGVDEVYERATAAGAIGGKLLGAGGGGMMLLFVPPSQQARVRERLNGLLHIPFKFESSGSQIIFLDHEEDYSAEEQLRINEKPPVFRELAVMQGQEAGPAESS